MSTLTTGHIVTPALLLTQPVITLGSVHTSLHYEAKRYFERRKKKLFRKNVWSQGQMIDFLIIPKARNWRVDTG